MTIVVDASVASKWMIDEPDTEQAWVLLLEDLVAPNLLRIECANAVIKRLRRGELNEAESRERLIEITRLPVSYVDPDETAAVQLALELAHPVYDCVYLALARHLGVSLVTADRRFLSTARLGGYGGHIRLLGEHQTR